MTGGKHKYYSLLTHIKQFVDRIFSLQIFATLFTQAINCYHTILLNYFAIVITITIYHLPLPYQFLRLVVVPVTSDLTTD